MSQRFLFRTFSLLTVFLVRCASSDLTPSPTLPPPQVWFTHSVPQNPPATPEPTLTETSVPPAASLADIAFPVYGERLNLHAAGQVATLFRLVRALETETKII